MVELFDMSEIYCYKVINLVDIKILDVNYVPECIKNKIKQERIDLFFKFFEEEFPVQSGRYFHLINCSLKELHSRYNKFLNDGEQPLGYNCLKYKLLKKYNILTSLFVWFCPIYIN